MLSGIIYYCGSAVFLLSLIHTENLGKRICSYCLLQQGKPFLCGHESCRMKQKLEPSLLQLTVCLLICCYFQLAMSYLFHGAVAGCSVRKHISKHLVNSDCYCSRAAQNVFQSISLVRQPSLFWALLEFLVFHSATSHHVLPILLLEGKRCGEGKERQFILYLVWTTYTFSTSHGCQHLFF